ncbi:MAG: (2Fe-2S) ferredoxin domain-containing protein [Chloroflexota bacterium]
MSLILEKTAIVLLGRGGYSKAPDEQMQQLVTLLESSERYASVKYAFIDGKSPSLPDVLTDCISDTVEDVVIVPIYMPSDRRLDSWVSRVMQRWLYHHPNATFNIRLTEAIGDAPELAVVVNQVIDRQYEQASQPLSPNHVSPNSPEWSVLPVHLHHVLMCRCPRCNTAGAGDCASQLSQTLRENKIGDEHVLVAQTGCLYPCNLGPVMVVYPEAVWYAGLSPEAIKHIVQTHFIEGQIVADYARYPANGSQQRPSQTERGD